MEKVPLDFAFGVAFGVLIPRWIRFRRERLLRIAIRIGIFTDD